MVLGNIKSTTNRKPNKVKWCQKERETRVQYDLKRIKVISVRNVTEVRIIDYKDNEVMKGTVRKK